ncbi:motility associated factor glycosyltransferase family protein [Oceanirhabdus sp. W0125-5]|uniref:motility associated factor glycosyltransferase family protein n=1 Tax=Oceanirhabdus sp. W0125-5 TaxID=2999116 RepID=UPI0022F2BF60|nr:6-hydroxymethylpterin diphosphokinase MptE-like protein [Oceanirhabdus sp. W0125-5]WBW96217.1 DUF115 domain-containing protein [Oceanirhabdus sp. W0125-5]
MNFNNFFKFLDELRYDSTIFILGIDNYLESLSSIITDKNKVFIFEVDEDVYNDYIDKINTDNIKLSLFSEENINNILSENIKTRNFLNIFANHLEEYESKYPVQTKLFYGSIDYYYYKAQVFVSTFKTFKELYFKNFISNVNHIYTSTCFDNLLDYYKNIPALIISAGPSLDENMKTLIKYKNRLKNFLIICGNRTLKPLVEADIIPDFVVSVDPQELTFNMIKDYNYLNIPLIFFEHSNSKLVDNYKGPKIFSTMGSFCNIKGLKNMLLCFSGGSVAHPMTHIACCLGCTDVIFLGQDFAYKDNKPHSDCSTFDSKENTRTEKIGSLKIKDVFGKDIYTDNLLYIYKLAMELFIEKVKGDFNFINSSKGAHIIGSIYKPLEKVLQNHNYNLEKPNFNDVEDTIKPTIELEKYILGLRGMLEQYIGKFTIHKKILIEITKGKHSIAEGTTYFYKMTDDLNNFLNSNDTIVFRGYIEEFLFEVKERYFKVLVKDYPVLSKNLMYQSSIFKNYIDDLITLLIEIHSEI